MARTSRLSAAWPRCTQRAFATALLLVTCLCAASPAQTPFAMRALGQNIESDSARDTGRGGWGMADSDTLAPGTRNPAALADLRYLGLIVSGFSEVTGTAGGGFTRTTRHAYLPNARFGVPLQPGRLVLHAGFNVQRSMKYETAAAFEFEHAGQTVRGIERYFREGTLYAIPVGLSWRALDALAVSAGVNLMRGTVNDAVSQVFTDPLGNYYLPSIREQRDELSGTNVTVAVLWDGWQRLQFGASATTGYDLDMERTIGLSGVAERARDRFNGAMPPQFKAGLQFELAGDWRLGADGQLSRFSAFSGRPEWESQLRDEWTVSAGIERPLLYRPFGRGYTVPWRLGYQHRQWAHTVGGAAVSERSVSVGTGFPFRNRLGTIDMALSYIWIGSQGENGWRSNSLRFGVSITGLEQLVF